jgi:hypothetical protein
LGIGGECVESVAWWGFVRDIGDAAIRSSIRCISAIISFVDAKRIKHYPQKPRALPKLLFFSSMDIETRAAVTVVGNNFVRLVRAISDCTTRRKLRRLFQSCIEFLHVWIQQQSDAQCIPTSAEIFAVTKCRLLQLGVSNTFVALLDPLMPCSHAQDATISDHFDCWEIMREKRSPSPSGSHATPSRKRSSSDCSLSDLSPLCNRQLLKHFCADNGR